MRPGEGPTQVANSKETAPTDMHQRAAQIQQTRTETHDCTWHMEQATNETWELDRTHGSAARETKEYFATTSSEWSAHARTYETHMRSSPQEYSTASEYGWSEKNMQSSRTSHNRTGHQEEETRQGSKWKSSLTASARREL